MEATNSQVNISHLATGTYVMKVAVNGQVGTYKLVKE
ncbi:T9SS type A sorting domain-containing protein [Altibacter sp.]